jgi:hypothetical protein
MGTHSSFSTIDHDHHFVLMTIAENQFHTSMLPRKEVKPLLLCLINLNSHFSQAAKTGGFFFFFKELSPDMSVSCSYSHIVSLEMLLAANGFLTHSNFETSLFSMYNKNCFCKALKWLMKFFC